MATLPNQILQQVITYNDAELAYLQNLTCVIGTLNHKFQNFQNIPKNLGDTVNLELPYRATIADGLVASFQGMQQRVASITCDQAANASTAFTAQQFIFNVQDYMEKFGRALMEELANKIEINALLNAESAVPVNTIVNGQTVPTGALYTNSGPFRFYGDGYTPINSFGQLSQMLAYFRNFGSAPGRLKVYLSDIATAEIVNTGLNQFVMDRNEEIALSWNLGTYKGSNADFYQSNLLPRHVSGTTGNAQQVLTLISTNDPTGANITQLTFSGASASDADAVKSGDMFSFQDGVSGQPDMRYLTWIGHTPSQNKVQFRATADAASDVSGHVTINIYPALQSTPGSNQNLNNALQPGMQVLGLPTHRCGLVTGGDAFYLVMPQLPEEVPYPTASKTDDQIGVSLRTYYGSLFGQNFRGLITDAIWQTYLQPEYGMRIIIPENQ